MEIFFSIRFPAGPYTILISSGSSTDNISNEGEAMKPETLLTGRCLIETDGTSLITMIDKVRN
jgi:hypothetical protein